MQNDTLYNRIIEEVKKMIAEIQPEQQDEGEEDDG